MKKTLFLSLTLLLSASLFSDGNLKQNMEVADRHPEPWSIKYEVADRHPEPWSIKYEVADRHPEPWSIKLL